MRLRIVFMGTPDFAVPSLNILVENGFDVVAVITSPDRLGGRGRKTVIESAVKKAALKHNIPILQPTNLKKPEFVDTLRSYNANLQIVVAFRMLPEVVWNMPSHGTYNLHGSLLPKYRGAAPINWAIIKGEKVTGVSFFKLKHEIDTGDMVLQQSMALSDQDTAGSLHDRMMVTAAETVLAGVKLIDSGDVTFTKQDEGLVTKAPKIFKETCEIDFRQRTKDVYNLIRGLSPFPTSWTTIDGKVHKIFRVTRYTDGLERTPGKILTNNKNYLTISTKDGYIHVLDIQQEGKRKMSIAQFLNGYTILSEKIS